MFKKLKTRKEFNSFKKLVREGIDRNAGIKKYSKAMEDTDHLRFVDNSERFPYCPFEAVFFFEDNETYTDRYIVKLDCLNMVCGDCYRIFFGKTCLISTYNFDECIKFLFSMRF